MTSTSPYCLYCDRSSDQIPLIQIQYQGQDYWICPQHLPVLIHKPSQLAGKLPGIENMETVEGHDLD
jgi:hypothetical protein